ncbi:FAD-dependent oxidoreductase [Nonomuraea sp. NPDC050643]|uniref:FAD-dependent oxidoreductase n=1 Tax=Nonomuraea sp. NPDC050643 TaxID=3155660 RepID=UPI0033E6C527
MSLTPRDLGMDRPISRRDFFDGIAVGALGSTLAGCGTAERTEKDAARPEPFTVSGDTSEALSVPHALRDGRFWEYAGPPEPTGESYDLVVVGAGRGGVSAAHEWLRRHPRARVLLLDNHDTLGGHETTGRGGTDGGPGGVDGVVCDVETFGADTLVRLASPGWIDRLPIAVAARRDLRMLHHDPPDWFPGLSAEGKQERLAELTYSQFLREVCAAHPDVERFCRTMPSRKWAYDSRAFGAIDAWGTGYPGFGGLGLDRDKPSRLNSPTVRREWHGDPGVPAAVPALDERVRLRLSSPVVSVRDGSDAATVGYFDGHRVLTVAAGAVILACWGAVVPHLLPELPGERRRALRRAVRVPLLHATVRVRDPRAWRRLGVDRVRWTGAYWSSAELASPADVRLLATPCRSELGPDAGSAAGRRVLIRTPYSVLERTVRDQLARLLGPVGFDPAGDIEAITIDRRGHANAPEYCRPWHPFYPDGPFPADAARGRFGRIAIAGSDAVPAARAEAAGLAAFRAVEELA